MARKCKFDPQWEQALSLLNSDDAQKAREIIECYQTTGVKPANLEARFEMILLLVQPTIDRRRTAASRARERRLRMKESTASAKQTSSRETSPAETTEQVKLQPSPVHPAPRRHSLAKQAMKHRRKQSIAQPNNRRFFNNKRQKDKKQK